MLQNNRKEHACFHCSTQNSTQPTRVCEKNLVKYIKFWRADFYYFCTHPLPPSRRIWEGHIMPGSIPVSITVLFLLMDCSTRLWGRERQENCSWCSMVYRLREACSAAQCGVAVGVGEGGSSTYLSWLKWNGRDHLTSHKAVISIVHVAVHATHSILLWSCFKIPLNEIGNRLFTHYCDSVSLRLQTLRLA